MGAYQPRIFDEKKLDFKLRVEDDDAFRLARLLFTQEGISAGISSGAALWGAIQVARRIKRGTVVVLFPDRGDRYLSTCLSKV